MVDRKYFTNVSYAEISNRCRNQIENPVYYVDIWNKWWAKNVMKCIGTDWLSKCEFKQNSYVYLSIAFDIMTCLVQKKKDIQW